MTSQAEPTGSCYQARDLRRSHQGHRESPPSSAHPSPPPPRRPPHHHPVSAPHLCNTTPTPPSHVSPPPTSRVPPCDEDPAFKDLEGQLPSISGAIRVLQGGDPAQENSYSWGDASQPSRPLLPEPGVSSPDNANKQASVLTKAELPDGFRIKSEGVDLLKQEHSLGEATSMGKDGRQLRAAAAAAAPSVKKTSSGDTGSKTMRYLAGQTFRGGEDLDEAHFAGAAPEPSAPDLSLSRQATAAVSASHAAGFAGQVGKKEEAEEDCSRPRKVRHKKRVNGSKVCLVCGDKALAHNFDVITCESCKAFFRRNALKIQSLQRCMFQNSCFIDKNTRRFCPACRLRKCFDIGMKAELMLDEEERRLRREKKAQRVRQQTAGSAVREEGSSGECPPESFSTMESDIPSFSTDTTAATTSTTAIHTTHPRQSFSSTSVLPQQMPASSLHPLPSFHTLQDPLSQSPSSSASQSSPYGHSSTLGISPVMGGGGGGGGGPSQPTSEEASPFSSFLTQLSTSSPVLFSIGHQSTTNTAQHNPSFPQSAAAAGFVVGSAAQGLTLGMESSSSPKTHHPGSWGAEKQQRQEEGCVSPYPEQALSLTVDNLPYPLPGPGARIFQHVPRDQLPSDPFMYWLVSSEERLVLANLTNAYQEVLLSLPERSLCRNMPLADSYLIQDFLNEIDDAMYKIVQFSKHIADFRQMRKEDQIGMLKASAIHTFGIACCAAYVHERDCWLSLRGDLTLSHLRKLTNDDPYIQVGVEYCRSVKSLVKNDFTVYALVHCMILFDPRDAKILDRQAINKTRDKYVIMLKHYLESQYSYMYADAYFVAIQERVREIITLAKTGNAMFKRYSSAFQPLITEMLSAT